MAARNHYSLPAKPEDRANLVPRELTKQEFGRRLQELTLKKDWNQSDLARAAGVGRDAISTYIRGLTFPTPKALRKLCNALGVTEEELLPNSVIQAIDSEQPAIELKQAPGHPDKTWLRINRMLPFGVAAQILALIHESDEREAQKG